MMNVYSRIFAILGFVLFFNLFIFHPVGNVALALILLGMLGFVLYTFRLNSTLGVKIRKISTVTAFIGSAILLFVDGPVRIMLLILLLILNMMITAYALMKNDYPRGILEVILAPIIDLGEYIRGGLSILKGTITGNGWKVLFEAWKKGKNTSGLKSTLFGILLGLPIVVILTSLLTQADPIFATFVSNLVSKEFLSQLQMRLVISTFITLFLIPFVPMRSRSSYRSPLAFLPKLDLRREVTVVMIMAAIVMGTFLVLSWPYVFAHVDAETSLIQYGIATYSEYVQKGFAELLKVVFLILGISWAGLLVYRGKENKEHAKWLKVVQGILLFELLIFVISIARRVGLYTEFHGLSLARLYGMSVLVWLTGMTVFMASRYYRKGNFYLYEIAWTGVVVIITSVINFDNIVLKNPPTVNGRVDYVYLSRMSSDGVKGWVRAYKWAQAIVTANSGNDKLFIGGEDRRDIYYAGMILQTNLSNYHKLLYKYGTDDEVKEYISYVVSSGLVPENKEKKDAEIDLNAYDYFRSPGKGKIDDFSTSNYPVSHFGYSIGHDRERLKGWDKLTGWSGAEYGAWKDIKQEMPYQELINKIKSYDILRAKIDKQPKTDRYVEVDISMMSPILR